MMTFEFGQVVAEREYTLRIKNPLGPSVFCRIPLSLVPHTIVFPGRFFLRSLFRGAGTQPNAETIPGCVIAEQLRAKAGKAPALNRNRHLQNSDFRDRIPKASARRNDRYRSTVGGAESPRHGGHRPQNGQVSSPWRR